MFEKYPQQILSDWDMLVSEQLPVFPEKKKCFSPTESFPKGRKFCEMCGWLNYFKNPFLNLTIDAFPIDF